MKKNIIISLALTTLLVSGCSIPFLSKKTETVKCTMDLELFNFKVSANFEDDKLIDVVYNQEIDVSAMTSEEKDIMKDMLKSSFSTIEEKDGLLIGTSTMTSDELADKMQIEANKTNTKEQFKKEMANQGLKCE